MISVLRAEADAIKPNVGYHSLFSPEPLAPRTSIRVISSTNIRYVIARLINMAVRPLALAATAYFFSKHQAEDLSLIIFFTSISMMLMAIDPHRAYYKKFFNHLPAGKDFSLYILMICVWAMLVATLMAAFLFTSRGSIFICILMIVAFLGDKLADEILRFCLFDKDITGWSHLVIGRGMIQLVGLGVCALFAANGIAFDTYLLLFAASWTIPYFGISRQIIGRLRKHAALFLSGWLWRAAAGRFIASTSLMLSSLITSAPTYFDKVVAILVDKSSLPPFLIVSMSFSIIGNFVDFFFVSRMRVELLRNDTPVLKIMVGAKLWLSVVAGILAAVAIITVGKLVLGRIYQFDYRLIGLIAVINVTLAITAIPQQVVYWRDGPAGTFRVELPFLLALATPFLIALGKPWRLIDALGVISVGLLVRLLLYLVRSHGPIRRRPAVADA